MKKIQRFLLPYLSFTDFNVINLNLSLKNKKLTIFIDGAYLNINNGIYFEKGLLRFTNWESISIRKYDYHFKTWIHLNEIENVESLENICKTSFSKSHVILSGFAKKSGQWMEWEITHAKIVAEFEPEPESEF